MKAEIITIGDELLIGQVVDTNSAFIAKELTKIGVEVHLVKSIQDEKSEILKALSLAGARADMVLITGGLGPTKDDITKEAFCDYLKDELIENPKALANVKKIFAKHDRPLLQVNRDQAKVPSSAIALINKLGTAPGMWFEKEETVYVSLPGVPFEMKALMREEVLPRITRKFDRQYIVQKTVLTYGVGESLLADRIKEWEENLPPVMSLAYLPGPGRVRLRLMAKGKQEEVLNHMLHQQLEKLKALIGDCIGGYEGEQSMQGDVAAWLKAHQKTLAIAESCTGGKLTEIFIEMAGASAYFKGGIVPYATAMKIKLLGVPQKTIDKYSVVSAETAKAMADQARLMFDTDYALSTTGNAGPTKGDSDAEVGTVFIGLATPTHTVAFEYNFGKQREIVVNKAVIKAVEKLKKEIFRNT